MKLSPSMNTLGDDRQLALALQIDSGSPQTQHYMPKSNPGSLPSGWNGNDGWVANSIIDVSFTFSVGTGAHTLKVRFIEFRADKEHVLTPPDVRRYLQIWMIEPTVVVQKIIIGERGIFVMLLYKRQIGRAHV